MQPDPGWDHEFSSLTEGQELQGHQGGHRDIGSGSVPFSAASLDTFVVVQSLSHVQLFLQRLLHGLLHARLP